jgi:hypothetical protein
MPVEDSDLPARLLSKDRYFCTLFALLKSEPRISQSVWGLLMVLPTNADLVSQLRSPSTGSSPGARRQWWESMLQSDCIGQLMYSLQTMESIMQDFGDAPPRS